MEGENPVIKVSELMSRDGLVSPEEFVQKYLSACGIEDVQQYLYPDMSVLTDTNKYLNIDAACDRIHKAAIENESVGILVDVDVDGMCSASVCYFLLLSCGIDSVTPFFHDGKVHGLGDLNGADGAIRRIIESDISLLIVPDASVEQQAANYLVEHGIAIVEIDHHMTVPRDHVLTVNCQWQDGVNKSACGTMVMNHVALHYCREHGIYSMPDCTDFVALATVSDVMDMRHPENRYYIWRFYDRWEHKEIDKFIAAMIDKLNRGDSPTQDNLAWRIAPAINAVVRDGTAADCAVVLDGFVGNANPDDSIKVMTKLKRRQDDNVRLAMRRIEPEVDNGHKVVFGFCANDEKSYTGLIAGKLESKFCKPAFVLRGNTPTTWSGSLRSPVPLANIINESKLAEAHGHECACGIVVKRANLKRFARFLDELDLSAETIIPITASIDSSDISLCLCSEISNNANLWGSNIPEPTFHLRLDNPRVNIYCKATTTIRLDYGGASFVLFRASKKQEDELSALSKNGGTVEIVTTLCVNSYNGTSKPQGIIKEIEISPNAPKESIKEPEFDFDTMFE